MLTDERTRHNRTTPITRVARQKYCVWVTALLGLNALQLSSILPPACAQRAPAELNGLRTIEQSVTVLLPDIASPDNAKHAAARKALIALGLAAVPVLARTVADQQDAAALAIIEMLGVLGQDTLPNLPARHLASDKEDGTSTLWESDGSLVNKSPRTIRAVYLDSDCVAPSVHPIIRMPAYRFPTFGRSVLRVPEYAEEKKYWIISLLSSSCYSPGQLKQWTRVVLSQALKPGATAPDRLQRHPGGPRRLARMLKTLKLNYTPAAVDYESAVASPAGVLQLDPPPRRINNCLYVSFPQLAQGFGAQVRWDPAQNAAKFDIAGQLCQLRDGDPFLLRGAEKLRAVAPPRVLGGKLFVPIRTVATLWSRHLVDVKGADLVLLLPRPNVAVAALKHLLGHQQPRCRAQAAAALGTVGWPAWGAIPKLNQLAKEDAEGSVRAVAKQSAEAITKAGRGIIPIPLARTRWDTNPTAILEFSALIEQHTDADSPRFFFWVSKSVRAND